MESVEHKVAETSWPSTYEFIFHVVQSVCYSIPNLFYSLFCRVQKQDQWKEVGHCDVLDIKEKRNCTVVLKKSKTNTDIFYKAFRENTELGQIRFSINYRSLDSVRTVWVERVDSFQRDQYKGVGTCLMRAVKKYGLKKKCTLIALVSLNQSLGFYYKLGFRSVSERFNRQIEQLVLGKIGECLSGSFEDRYLQLAINSNSLVEDSSKIRF